MIDVIIPAFNAHDTIKNTLMSLALQRLSGVLDLYIIDDGSTIGYQNDIQYFLNNHFFKSLHLIRNEKNMGVGFCRKLAMEQSKKITNNPWIFFIDSDDYMASPYAFNEYLSLADIYPNAKVIYSAINQEMGDLAKLPLDTNYKNLLRTDSLGNILYLHGRIYNRAAIESIGLTFPATRSNEDIAFNLVFFQLYHKPEYSIFSKSKLVCTNYNINSITRSSQSTRGTPKNYHSCNEMYDCYLACKETFQTAKNILNKKKNVPSCLNLSNFVDKFLFDSLKAIGYFGQYYSEEQKELWILIHAKYYNDIIVPLLKNTPVGYSFKMQWFHNNLDWNYTETPETKEKLKAYYKFIKTAYNEKRFNELASKYLTDKGYTDFTS